MPLEPMRPLGHDWYPNKDQWDWLTREFGHLVDLNLSLRRFRNHYAEGQTSRNWSARFENWVLSDAARARDALGHATDDLGRPLTQRTVSAVVPPPAKPGDADYFDPEGA